MCPYNTGASHLWGMEIYVPLILTFYVLFFIGQPV